MVRLHRPAVPQDIFIYMYIPLVTFTIYYRIMICIYIIIYICIYIYIHHLYYRIMMYIYIYIYCIYIYVVGFLFQTNMVFFLGEQWWSTTRFSIIPVGAPWWRCSSLLAERAVSDGFDTLRFPTATKGERWKCRLKCLKCNSGRFRSMSRCESARNDELKPDFRHGSCDMPLIFLPQFF